MLKMAHLPQIPLVPFRLTLKHNIGLLPKIACCMNIRKGNTGKSYCFQGNAQG